MPNGHCKRNHNLPSKSPTKKMTPADTPATPPADPQATIEELLADPETAEAVRAIQRDAIAMIEEQTDALVLALGRAEPAARITQTQLPVNVRALTSTSRQASALVQSRRKFARDILIASVINRENEAWDMTDASTWRTDPDDLLLALMKMPLLS
jgi:hypothetical protein